MENTLNLLADWFVSHCNGEWEQVARVEVRSLDNPGWSLTIDLSDTYAENLMLKRVEIERSPEDWYHCWLEGDVFQGAGGAPNLPDLIRFFGEWISTYEEQDEETSEE